MFKPSWWTEGLGWVGVAVILAAYALLTFRILDAGDWEYHALNMVGSVGIVLDALAQRNWQPALLNVVWFGLAAFGILAAFGVLSGVHDPTPPGSAAATWLRSCAAEDRPGSLGVSPGMTVLDEGPRRPYHCLAGAAPGVERSPCREETTRRTAASWSLTSRSAWSGILIFSDGPYDRAV